MIIIQLALLATYSGLSYFLITPWTAWLWLVIGLVIGWLTLFFDTTLFYKYYLEPHQQKISPKPLISRSIIFLVVFVPLSLFVVSSSGSLLGIGVVVAMVVVYLSEIISLKNDQSKFAQNFLWQTKAVFSQSDRNLMTGVFLVLLILLVWLGLF